MRESEAKNYLCLLPSHNPLSAPYLVVIWALSLASSPKVTCPLLFLTNGVVECYAILVSTLGVRVLTEEVGDGGA
jgi:hypothetical protein